MKQLRKPKVRKLFLKLETKNEVLLNSILQELKVSSGQMPVVIYFSDTKKKMIAPKHLWVNNSESLLNTLKSLLGEDSVIVQ